MNSSVFSRLVLGFDVQDGFALAELAPGRLNEISGGLNVYKYYHEWIEHMFSVFGLNKYLSDWIEILR